MKIALHSIRLLAKLLKATGHQASTLPGRLLNRVAPQALTELAKRQPVLVVTGTNGKTTTVSLVVKLLRDAGLSVCTNSGGANLRSGLTTALALYPGQADVAVLEVDEAAFAICARELNPRAVLVTNLFRDQLDRYGEMQTVFELLEKGGRQVPHLTWVLNADDPLVSALDKTQRQAVYYGYEDLAYDRLRAFDEPVSSDAVEASWHTELDTAACPLCSEKLTIAQHTISHLGNYRCTGCGWSKPQPTYRFEPLESGRLKLRHVRGHLTQQPDQEPDEEMLARIGQQTHREISIQWPLQGLYNAYNACAAWALADLYLNHLQGHSAASAPTGTNRRADLYQLAESLQTALPSFGRQERIQLADNKQLCLLLSKNPAGLTQNLNLLRQATDRGGVVLCLNSRLADSCDLSWIWDTPFERYRDLQQPWYLSGERRGDAALRLHYAGYDVGTQAVYDQPIEAVEAAVKVASPGQTVYLLVNYTAMLALRAQLADRYHFGRNWIKEAS